MMKMQELGIILKSLLEIGKNLETVETKTDS